MHPIPPILTFYLPPPSSFPNIRETEEYNMKISLKKWKCTVCSAKGKRWQSSWRANRSGRQHINSKHDGNGNLKILKKKKITN